MRCELQSPEGGKKCSTDNYMVSKLPIRAVTIKMYPGVPGIRYAKETSSGCGMVSGRGAVSAGFGCFAEAE